MGMGCPVGCPMGPDRTDCPMGCPFGCPVVTQWNGMPSGLPNGARMTDCPMGYPLGCPTVPSGVAKCLGHTGISVVVVVVDECTVRVRRDGLGPFKLFPHRC